MKTWEMIKKLTENPKLQARGSARGHTLTTVAINEFGSLVEVVSGEIPLVNSFVTLTHDILSVYDWELLPQPFMGAAKSGKRIRPDRVEWGFYPVQEWFLKFSSMSQEDFLKFLNYFWYVED